ncbi:MAG: carbonic anhydrase [Rhodospirillales bacterium]|nr:carbonic anhydrase [Rhodospirillales bacterium]
MDSLISGYARFRTRAFPELKHRFRELAAGQSPTAAIVACCDSRVDPQMVFDSEPGELFTIRNVANLVPPYEPSAEYHGTSAALEFAVRKLEVPDLVVMGHAHCGGIRALIENGTGKGSDFIGPWMAIAAPLRDQARSAGPDIPIEAVRRTAELESVRISIRNLLTFPWIRERVEAGTLNVHGFFYDFAPGALWCLDQESGCFVPVTIDERAAPPEGHGSCCAGGTP